MGDKSKIEWCDATWNPIVGCSLVSPGCTNCYAMGQARRIERMAPVGEDRAIPQTHYFGTTKSVNLKSVWTGKIAIAPDHILASPLHWKRPRRIFVNSMGDLFHESVPDARIVRVFAVMALAPQHTFHVLTKRSKRMREWANDPETPRRVWQAAGTIGSKRDALAPERASAKQGARYWGEMPWPLKSVWLGVSAEDQPRADERIPDLLATPAAVRFVSAEPLLGAIRFDRIFDRTNEHVINALTGRRYHAPQDNDGAPEGRLDWIITGGESGQHARGTPRALFQSIRDQCAATGTAYFHKQNGEFIDADEWMRRLTRDGAIKVYGFDYNPNRALTFDQAASLATNAGWPFEHQSDGSTLLRVGKRRAGRLLDGIEHNAMPGPRR